MDPERAGRPGLVRSTRRLVGTWIPEVVLVVVQVVRRWDAAEDVGVVVVAPQQAIRADVERLHGPVGRDAGRKRRPADGARPRRSRATVRAPRSQCRPSRRGTESSGTSTSRSRRSRPRWSRSHGVVELMAGEGVARREAFVDDASVRWSRSPRGAARTTCARWARRTERATPIPGEERHGRGRRPARPAAASASTGPRRSGGALTHARTAASGPVPRARRSSLSQCVHGVSSSGSLPIGPEARERIHCTKVWPGRDPWSVATPPRHTFVQ